MKVVTAHMKTMPEKTFSSELCWGRVMVAYIRCQQRKKSDSLRGEGDKIKFIMYKIMYAGSQMSNWWD